MRRIARGRRKPGEMNKLESEYNDRLALLLHNGEIDWFKYEGIKLRLAPATFLTPDFFVMLANGEMEVHEVKGFMEGDALVKLKVAAEMYPFRFYLCKKPRKADPWSIVEIAP